MRMRCAVRDLIDTVANALRAAAATHILPRYRNLSDADIHEKTSAQDLVTAADVEMERALVPVLEGLIPGSRVIGEEGVSADKALLAELRPEGVFWLVDPVDGTWNFVHGKREFASMAALVRNGETVAGWIYAPLEDRCAIAEKGAGASWGGERLDAGEAPAFAEANGDYPARIMPADWRARIGDRPEGARTLINLRCSAYTYLNLARGALDFYLPGQMTPWDHAAGALLVSEAGGRVAFLDDRADYTPLPHPNRPLLGVRDADVWADYAAALGA